MASAIYYPRSILSPQEVSRTACPANIASDDFERRLIAANFPNPNSQMLCAPNRPLVIPPSDQRTCVGISPVLACSSEEHRTLSQLSRHAGGATVMGIANFLFGINIPNIIGDLNTFGGNGMGAALAQSNTVLGAIDRYDHANKNYEDLRNHRASPRMVHAAKLRAEAAFKEMNEILFTRSKNYLNNNTFRVRETTNMTGRSAWESIPVRDTADVQTLSRFAKMGRIAGPGFILVDGYLRANSVYHSWENGENWERKAVVEGGAFAGGIAAGAAIGLVIAFTPVGLVVGVVAAGAVAVGADYALKELLGNIYDWVTG